MSQIASRLRLGALCALPAVAAGLAFAPSALATVFTATNTAQLVADINSANTAGGQNEIILSPATTYAPTTPLTITSGDFLEITGPPQNNATSQSKAAIFSGTSVNPDTSPPMTVAPGAHAVFKAFNTNAGGVTTTQFEINGTAEFDNMAVEGGANNDIEIDSTTQTASVVVNDSLVANAGALGIQNDTQSSLYVNDSTIADNSDETGVNGGGVAGNVVMNNTLLVNNSQNGSGEDCAESFFGVGTVTATNSIDDDGTCGVTTSSSVNLGTPKFGTGPVASAAITTSSSAYTLGGAGCEPVDGRFFTFSHCAVGAYQVSGATAPDATAPACTIQSVNESTNPAVASTEVVNAMDAGSGLSLDAISGATTTNGTVAWPVIMGTPWDETTPSNANDPDLATTGAFPVTATKPVGDLTTGDTKWSFTATSWSGISSLCK
jgi:hypothetical protein